MKKKLLKKILSIFLIVVMVLGVTPIFGEIGIEFSFKSNAAKLDFGDYTDTPSLNEWRADCYSSHFDSTFMINDSPSYSGIFFESLNNDVSFRAGLASWDAICVFTSPGDVIETFSKQEYYDALLIDLLSDNNKSSFLSDVVDNYDSMKNGIDNSYTKYIYSVTKTIIGEDKLDDSSEVRKILTMSPDYYIAKYLNEGEKIGRKVLVDTKYKSKIEFIDVVGDFFEFADTIETAIKCTCKYISINEAKDGTEQILKYIIKDQNNPTALRNAAYECWECFEEGFNGVIKSFINGTGNTLINKTVKTMLDEAYKGAWKKLATIYPGAESVLLLAKGTKILMKFFNVDVVAGAFYNLEATVNLEKALISCVNNFKNEYIETRSESAAVNYMSAISMYENMAQNSFDSSIDMLKAYIKTPIANTFWQDTVNDQTGETVEGKITEANKIIKEIETFKKNKNNNFDTFENITTKAYHDLFCPSIDKIVDGTSANLPNPGYNEILLPTKQLAKSDLLYKKNDDNSITIEKYIGRNGKYECVAIPSEIDGMPVKEIAPNAFYGESFYRIIIPQCVEKIGNKAFWGHMYLKNLMILGKNTVIGDRAFGWEIKSGGKILLDESSNNTEVYGETNSSAKQFADSNEGFYFNYMSKAPGWYVEPMNSIYHIYSTGDLKKVINNSETEHFENCTIKLEHNLYLGNDDWTPIGQSSEKYFAGSFDGNGFNISTFKYKGETKNVDGLFGYVKGSNNFIGNFTINSDVDKNLGWDGCNGLGAVIGRLEINNSNFTMKNIKCGGWMWLACPMGSFSLGGAIGVIKAENDSNIELDGIHSIYNSFTGISTYQNVILGGIVGTAEGDGTSNLEISNCYSNNTYKTTSQSYSQSCVGGIIGTANKINLKIYNSATEGSMSLGAWKNYCGGIIGSLTSAKTTQIKNCFICVTPSAHDYAGVFGYSNTVDADIDDSVIENCISTSKSDVFYNDYAAFSSYNTDFTNKFIPIVNCYYNSNRFCAPSLNASISVFYSHSINNENQTDVHGLTETSMKKSQNYNLDFGSTWDWCDFRYPFLQGLNIQLKSLTVPTRYNMKKGQKITIPLDFSPESAAVKVSAYSTNNDIATLDGDEVTAKSIGFCWIKITLDNGMNKSIGICCTENQDYEYELIENSLDEIRLIKCNDFSSKRIDLPEEIDGYKVVEIGDDFFSSSDTPSCEELIVSKTIRKIPERSLNSASSLKRISVDPENETLMDVDGVLYSADGKKLIRCPENYESEVNVLNTVEEISSYGFYNCVSTKVTLPKSLNSIKAYSFCNSKLNSIELPQNVRTIGGYAFNGCNGLKEITIPENLESIGIMAFYGCENLSTVNYSAKACSTVSTILLLPMFQSNVENFNIDDEVESLPAYILNNSPVKEITIPGSVKFIDSRAFRNMPDLTIKAYLNSCAKEYAEKNGYNFVPITCGNCLCNEWEVEIDSTCTSVGKKSGICSVCGAPIIEEIPTKNHNYGDWKIIKEATCISEGLKTKTCADCGDVVAETIAKTAHRYMATNIKPTCTEDGYTKYICSVCGDSYTDNVVPASGHTDTDNNGICDACGEKLEHTQPSDPSKDCTCMCHKTGFIGFIYKIIRIFWKIFRINKTCSCGSAHY